VYLEVDGDMNLLLLLCRGQGRAGEDIAVKVPPRTEVRSSDGGVELS
jgi:hypothetical protein